MSTDRIIDLNFSFSKIISDEKTRRSKLNKCKKSDHPLNSKDDKQKEGENTAPEKTNEPKRNTDNSLFEVDSTMNLDSASDSSFVSTAGAEQTI